MKDLDIEDVVFLSRARLKTRGADGADQLLDRIVDTALTVQVFIISGLEITLLPI
jgi:hypothetical protein